MTCHIKAFKAQRGAVTPGKNPEHQSCDSIKVTLLEEKKNKKIRLRLHCAVKSFVTAAGDPSTLLVQL